MGLFDRMKDAQQQAQQAMAGAAGTQGMPAMGDMAAQQAYAQKAQKLHAHGVEAPGVINAVRPTGGIDMGGGQEIDFDVTITPAGGQPYSATIRQSILAQQVGELTTGKSVTVKYDPDDPSQALIYGW